MIDELKNAIRETVEAILNFAEDHEALLESSMHEAVNRWRRARCSDVVHSGKVGQETVSVALIGNPVIEGRASGRLAIDDVRSSLEAILWQCDEEWVSEDDFFGPVFGIYDESGDEPLQRGEFIIAYNPNLSYVGNFIARCLLVRSDSAIKVLREVTDELRVTFNAARNRTVFPWIALQEHVDHLADGLRESLLLTEEAKLAEAAMTLVQIRVEFSREFPVFDWLPLDPSIMQGFRVGLRDALQSVRGAYAAERIKDGLQCIRDWCEDQPTREAALAEAIASKDLVIDEVRRRVFWKSRLIEVDWHRHQKRWTLLRKLARAARELRVLSHEDFYGHPKGSGKSKFGVLKNELKNMLPAELHELIIPVPQEGYRLNLGRGQMHVFPAP
jgi:hypothetical protein